MEKIDRMGLVLGLNFYKLHAKSMFGLTEMKHNEVLFSKWTSPGSLYPEK